MRAGEWLTRMHCALSLGVVMTDVAEQVIQGELRILAEEKQGGSPVGWGYREVRRIDAWSAFFVPGPNWFCVTGMLPDFSAYPDGVIYTTSHPLLAISEGYVVEQRIQSHLRPGGYVYALMGAKSDDHRKTLVLDGYGMVEYDGEWPAVNVTQTVAQLIGRGGSI